MIARIRQRTHDDCIICAVAMVMGPPYTYERVLIDSATYPSISDDGKFLAWWEKYLRDSGFQITYRRFLDLYELPRASGSVVGLLHLSHDGLRKGHIVAVDEAGIIDPADGAEDHIEIQSYILTRLQDGFTFDSEFLAIRRVPEIASRPPKPLARVGKSAQDPALDRRNPVPDFFPEAIIRGTSTGDE